jgi:rfaE bifunctional protein nucleotidyltransferase chain/domain
MIPAPDTTRLKIHGVSALAEIIAGHKAKGEKVVHCHGVFDLVHPGHIRYLEAARKQGDILVVTITADRFVNKGPGRPAFNEGLRAEFLAAIEFVSYVAINHASHAVDLIRALKPDVYVKGSDYARREDDPTGKIYEEEQAIIAVGGRIHFTDEITFSSSTLINANFSIFPPETEQWLAEFRTRRSIDEVMGWLDKAAAQKILVMGEPIIDEYAFCEGLGKSSKDPILALHYRSLETYAGGSVATANHAAGLGGEVGFIAQLGEMERREDFIRRHLLPNVEARFTNRRNAPTIHKRRFVDAGTGARVFELYTMDDGVAHQDDEAALIAAINEMAPAYDLVVVADYGHGMMTPAAVQALADKAKFLVVNTQANAGNRGFNTVSKYPRADYICLAGHEVQLETRMKHAGWLELIDIVASRVACPNFTVTVGKSGTIHRAPDGSFTEVPAFASVVTDRVGAGDAVLAITAPLVAIGAPWDIVGFIGNIAGGQMVADLGNRVTINRVSLVKAITALMK